MTTPTITEARRYGLDESNPTMVQAMQNKVPTVTLGFWVIKILATTLGETGRDTVTMTINLGYLTGTAISCRP